MSHSEQFRAILDSIWNHPDNDRIIQISAAIREIGILIRNSDDQDFKLLCLAAQQTLFAESARIIAEILDETNL